MARPPASTLKVVSAPSERPVIVSWVHSGRSAIKLLAELWYTTWHEAHH